VQFFGPPCLYLPCYEMRRKIAFYFWQRLERRQRYCQTGIGIRGVSSRVARWLVEKLKSDHMVVSARRDTIWCDVIPHHRRCSKVAGWSVDQVRIMTFIWTNHHIASHDICSSIRAITQHANHRLLRMLKFRRQLAHTCLLNKLSFSLAFRTNK